MSTTRIESKLMNQGSYGCIYYPSLPFKLQKRSTTATATATTIRRTDDHNNHDDKRKFYVSKLQKHNFHSEFEDYIGKKIQKIPSFDIFFVPILTTHKIDLTTIKQNYVTDCRAINKYLKSKTSKTTKQDLNRLNKQFIVQKMKYINGIYLHRHLQNVVSETNGSDHSDHSDHRDHSDHSDHDDHDDRESTLVSKTLRKDEQQIKKYRSEFKRDELERSYHLMSIAFDLYERIMDSIQLLIQHKIVHYDLKENNILVEKTQQLPYIIDFGLSIDVERLLQYQWSDKAEKAKATATATLTATARNSHTQQDDDNPTIDSNVLYSSSKIFKDNYLWKQHFYIHAPDYYLWPLEVHLMTYLINENDTLTEESLRKICFEYIKHNRAIQYMSRDFKKKMFDLSVSTFAQFIEQPREKVLNELLTHWDKWDMYAINIMFLKIMYELIFHIERDTSPSPSPSPSHSPSPSPSPSDSDSDSDSASQNEKRQQKLDPYYSSDTEIEFKSKYKVKLKQKYNSYKIMNTIQVMLRNIHPNPDKRMTPQETKVFFVSIFYEC